ncbi:Tad domain-containing protein [Fictibacillus sp. 7GRE50]|uniref:Tad domain-containing protein n=1 Tax=unclassified Fictibacillus TaxID=2644029 RepID=UPI0018CE037C|nr:MULTISPECIES: Tad domain-containing protein [unclassified Fictibacillus]MBH0167590.1 Tad domain-containing protein [Fictibacillus sp. 7GRE50]MBH0176155.1 Tad domain-containing protein [Fictibacillus sp. 23RED33]
MNNERGNATFYLIWLLGLTALLFFFVINISKVFFASEQATNAAEHASLAATDVVYDAVNEAVSDFDSHPIHGPLFFASHGLKSLKDIIEKRKLEIRSSDANITDSEAQIIAINEVLSEEIPQNKELHDLVKSHLEKTDTIFAIQSVASQNIISNGAKDNNASIKYFNSDERIEVDAEADSKLTSFQGFFEKSLKEISKTGQGPEVPFVKYLNGWSDREIPLDF